MVIPRWKYITAFFCKFLYITLIISISVLLFVLITYLHSSILIVNLSAFFYLKQSQQPDNFIFSSPSSRMCQEGHCRTPQDTGSDWGLSPHRGMLCHTSLKSLTISLPVTTVNIRCVSALHCLIPSSFPSKQGFNVILSVEFLF